MSNETREASGPAFPVRAEDGIHSGSTGMSLRDAFAITALIGLLIGQPDSDCGLDGYCHDAYLYADGMLKARKT